MNNSIVLPLIAAILYVAMITVNVLANALPINGLDTGEVSDLYPTLFTPSGITFSIWSVIYFFLAGGVIVMWINRNDSLIQKVLMLFCASCILNIGWIIAWHYLLPGLSVVIMIVLLLVLINIFLTLQRTEEPDKASKVWIKFAFTVYFAWISVATIANMSAFLVSVGWDGGFLSGETWAVIMMLAAATLAVIVTSKFGAYWYSVVVIWALLGIFMKRRGTEYDYIEYSSLAFALVLATFVVYVIYRNKRNAIPV